MMETHGTLQTPTKTVFLTTKRTLPDAAAAGTIEGDSIARAVGVRSSPTDWGIRFPSS